MSTNFLDYYKMVLDKVSFDRDLFVKEYRKATNQLPNHEVADLNRWISARGHQKILSTSTYMRDSDQFSNNRVPVSAIRPVLRNPLTQLVEHIHTENSKEKSYELTDNKA